MTPTTYQLAKYVNTLISPLAGETSSFIKNTQSLVDSIKNMCLQPIEVIVSFDIVIVYQCPSKETLGVIHWKLLADESLGERTALSADQVTHLLDLCLQTTYFLYKGEYYQQKHGAAMGSPVSPVVANIHMEMLGNVHVETFEDLVLETKMAPRIWKSYVDYTFCVIEEMNARHFLDYLNTLHPSIQFKMELEEDGSLPFLETLLTRREDSRIDVDVYQKPTHTD